MCEVKDTGGAGETSTKEDDALEKIFLECDVTSTGRVSVAKLIGYMRDRMTSTQGSPEILKDLRASMCAASHNGEVTRKQYHDVSRRWLIKVRKRQRYLEDNHQDGNNNLHVDRDSDSLDDDTVEMTVSGTALPGTAAAARIGTTPAATLGLTVPAAAVDGPSLGAADLRSTSDAGSHRGYLDLSTSTVVDDIGIRCESAEPYFGDLSSVEGTYHMAVGDPGAETAQDLRLRAHRSIVDNEHLREELQRAEDSIATLERQLAANERKLELVNIRCERLQGEHEEHKELLAAAERDREALGTRNQRLERDNSVLRAEIHAADTEMRRLNADLDKASEQKEEWIRLLAHCQEELIERQAMYDEAKGRVLRMELAHDKLSEEHAVSTGTTEHLRIVVKELETRIAEIQLNHNYALGGEWVFASPDSDNGLRDEEAMLSQDPDKLIPRSLHDELKAMGYNDGEAGRGEDVRNLNETTEECQSAPNCEYADAVRLATEELERATARVAASYEGPGIGPPPAQSPLDAGKPSGETRVHSTESGEYFPSAEYLQRFKSQIQHVLTILPLLASRKVANAETKDATTQLDCRDLVPELEAVGKDIDEFSHRYIRTLPSGGPSDFAGKMSRGVSEPPMSPIPTDARRTPSVSPSRTKMRMRTNEPASDNESETGGDVCRSYGWRRRESTTPNDTSDDTCGTSSGKCHSTSSEESNRRSPVPESSTSSPNSPERTEAVGLERMGKIVNPETYRVGSASASVENQTSPTDVAGDGRRGSDVLEELNSVLERLTLKTASPAHEQRARHTDHRTHGATFDARGYSSDATSSAGLLPHGKLPKRKSSVYRRSSDFCVALETVEKNEAIGSSGNGASRPREGGPPRPVTAYDTASATVDRHPCEASGTPTSSAGLFATTGIVTDGVSANLDIRSWPTMIESNRSKVSPGDRRTEYVFPDNRSPPLPTTTATTTTTTTTTTTETTTATTTRCLPPSDEILGDAASADPAEWLSDDREITAGSRSVARAMSSEEDSSDSECTRDRIDREERAQVALVPPPPALPPSPLPLSQARTQAQNRPRHTSPLLPQPQRQPSTVGSGPAFPFDDPLACNGNIGNERIAPESEEDCQRRPKNPHKFGRSLSESDFGTCRAKAECRSGCGCSCGWNGARDGTRRIEGEITTEVAAGDSAEETTAQKWLRVFPNLPDTLLIELELAVPSDGPSERIGEDELERKYTALSIGLETDRATLPQRLALGLRQRDQAERNLTTEVEKMQRDIQALAPLCVDRESVERVERVRHQLEMISRCALRVSCTAELLGATHQERRVSRVALLADRYLQAMRARCDKMSADLAETKRILTENNIVVEENPNELGDDIVPRLRYRGVPPAANRATISRRRASIATIPRPTMANTLQEATIKDIGRQQRASVPGRMTLRRPSLGYDTQRWENDKLDRTDSSSSSIAEIREIFEPAESRRGSREENNNLIRSQSSNFSVGSCESGDSDVWAIPTEEPTDPRADAARDEESSAESTFLSRRTPWIFGSIQERVSRLPVSWYILFVAVFFFGFYCNRYVATRSAAPFKWWSIDEITKRYVRVRRNVPPPI